MTEEQAQEFLTTPGPSYAATIAVYKQMYRLTLRVLRDEGEAEDAAGEALFKAWQNRSSYDGNRRAITWLNAIATHAALDSLRRRARILNYAGLAGQDFDSMGATFTEPEMLLLLSDIQDALDSTPGARELLLEPSVAKRPGRPSNRAREEYERVRNAVIAFLSTKGWDVTAHDDSGGMQNEGS
jgi:DNA-directed RNA polymerase specialized sigma24 family protein